MGQYIECYAPTGKADILLDEFGGEEISVADARSMLAITGFLDASNMTIVCVVCNPGFEAAAHCFSTEEFEVFADTTNDPRPRKFLLLNNADQVREAVKTRRVLGMPPATV